MGERGIEAVYRLHVARPGLEARVDGLLLEQTVEVPRSALTDERVRETAVGRVLAVEPDDDSAFRVTIEQPAQTAASDPAQLLNVLFGNSSLQHDVELVDLRVPDGLARSLGGPSFGLAGLRRLAGVEGRALTCSTVKPMGLSADALGALCRTLAVAGIDVIKDDHGLADHEFCPFADRVQACLRATAEAADATGRRAVYVPNLMGTPGVVVEQAKLAQELGAAAVMVAPMLLGLPFLNELVRSRLDVPVLAHPALGGAQRISPLALFGVLYPLYGADAVIFTSFGTRFSHTREACAALAEEVRSPRAVRLPALPVPAGGIAVEQVDEALDLYGTETMLLIGGSLLVAGDGLLERAREFAARVEGHRGP